MYLQTKCPVCNECAYHNIRLHVRNNYTTREIEVTAAEITDTCTTEELVGSVLHELATHVYNGITTRELCKILKEQFGILAQYCCDIVQRLKLELDMYCPDHLHLCIPI